MIARAAGRPESAGAADAAAPARERGRVDRAARRPALGRDPPRTATTSLQNTVSQLRKLLGAELVQTRPTGYMLVLNGAQLDLVRFEQLVQAARSAEAPERARLLREALDVWRGQPLADSEIGGVRTTGDPAARGAAARRARGADRRRPRERRRRRARGRARAARPPPSAAGAAARPAHARPLSLGPAGRRAQGLPRCAAHARRGARDRARAGAPGAVRLDPASGAHARPSRRRRRSRTTTTR